jgi:hypothetical protein
MTDLNHPFKASRLLPVLLFAAVSGLAGACGSGDDSSGSKPTEANAPATSESTAAIDACSLISAEDISALLGTTVQGKPGADPKFPGCTWENKDNYESVTLEIGNPGTAPGNTLAAPDPEFPDVGTPGPDGMRYLGGGQVEFPAGNRSNTVQVAVVKLFGGQANAAAVDLARKVGPKIPS